MFEGTSGKWYVDRVEANGFSILAEKLEGNDFISVVYGGTIRNYPDALLISNAPDMLATLQYIAKHSEDKEMAKVARHAVKAATQF